MNKLHAMSSSHSTAGLFGIDVHLSKVESLLNMESPDVLIVGIWGMGGIGKTTIAEAVCNKVRSRFEGIFFANFRDKQSDLQRKFLKRLLGQETLNTMVSMSFRDSFVRDRLRRIKVFIVLDDVDDSMPLEEWRDLLDGRNSSFGPGSKVVITSRDKQVLRNVVDETYEVEGLNHEDAIQLFSSKALKNCIPTIDQRHLIEQIVRHVQGNPLTLKVLGSSLYGKSIEEWHSALNKLVLSLQTPLPTRVLLLFLRLFLHKTMAMFFLFLSIFLFFYIWIVIIRNRHISPSPSTPSTLGTAQPQVPKYDVFLSFRGEDTRFDFTSHLYAALNRKQILTFIDYQLVRGDEIPPSLLIRTIEEAKLSVIVFSENYASSKWCLEELAKIFERRKNNGQIVIPVFYQVDPSHVRNQTGSFGDAFARLIKKKALTMDKEQSFRDALTDAATLSGWTLGNSG
ncbi:hypothetical protein NC651_040369 [Populus alba x Populus x berolinensis]|nr:hypothetical protein NC651_040369 [Populus alba x Populus x berolinensis]